MARHIPGPLYYEQIGHTGMPMVFLHSTPDDHRLWIYQTAHFSSWYRCLAVDLAGYGRSPIPEDGAGVADQAAACWEVVDRISDGKAIIHGNSMGSMVAMHMAYSRPERVPALILSGTGYMPTREVVARWEERYRKEGIALRYGQNLDHFAPAHQNLPLTQYYARMVNELNNNGTLENIIAMNHALGAAEEPPDFYRKVAETPTLIISGTADRNHAAAIELHKNHVTPSEFRAVEGAGHSMMQETPWFYDHYTIEFLAKHGLWGGPLPS